MSYAYNQDWPIEPRIPTRCMSGGRDPVINTSDDIQTWNNIATMAIFLLVQVTSSSLIIQYDPSDSAARHMPHVSLMWNPGYHAFTDTTVTSCP